MKKAVKHLTALVLAMAMLLAMTACSSSGELKYTKEIEDVMGRLTETSNTFATDVQTMFNDLSDDNRTTVMGDLAELEKVFQDIAALTAPKKYEEVQKLLNESSESALKGIAVYRTELGAVTAETMDEAFLERVTVGDDYLKEAQSKMLEAANLAEEIES